MKCPQHYLIDMQEFILFYNQLDVPTQQILDSKGAIPSKTAADAKIAIQEMAEYSQKWHNRTSSRTKSTKTSNSLAAIQAQLNNLGWEIKKANEKVYATQVGYELCKGPHYTKDSKRHEENSNIIKEIRASTDAAIRNQGASIKTLEIQIGQMSKVLQERWFGSLPSSTRSSGAQILETKEYLLCSILSETVPFLGRLLNLGCDDWTEVQDVTILDANDQTLPQKEKDPRSFTLPCFIHHICLNKALVDLGASVSVMSFSTYTNLGLGILSHTRLTIELADQTIKQPRGIAENVLVRIGKFIFPIDFIILDIPEDDDVPLILGQPFLSNAHSKIDVFKRKITLRVWEEKLVFKSIKPAASIIKRVFVIKSIDSKMELIGEGDEPFDPTYGFTIIDDDDMTKYVVLGMRFCKKYTSCQRIMKKFALGNNCERIMEEE
ncbi:hypothetical protein Tco_0275966 [Tanacetum coccineum]